jgi:hypothetical protein
MKRVALISISLMVLSGLMLSGVNLASAEAAGKQFEGISVVFFPGGSEGGPFASVKYAIGIDFGTESGRAVW